MTPKGVLLYSEMGVSFSHHQLKLPRSTDGSKYRSDAKQYPENKKSWKIILKLDIS